MSVLKIAAVLLVAVVLQLTIFVDVRVFGVAPELMAAVAVLSGFLAGPERGATVAFITGLLWDVWLPTPLGLAAISFALVAFGVGSLESGLFHDSRIQVAAIGGIGTFATVIAYALLGEVVGQRGLVDLELGRVALIAGFVGAVLAPPLMRPLRWALRSTDRFGAAAPSRA